jgi:transcriptional regulator with XRE-family HTH domain
MKENNKNIGARLKKFAKERFGTAANLAIALGMSPQQLDQYTSGKTKLSADKLKLLKDVGCDIEWLLNDKSEINNNFVKNSGSNYATGTGKHTQVYHISENKSDYNIELEILKTENERLKSELKKAERIIELLEKK